MNYSYRSIKLQEDMIKFNARFQSNNTTHFFGYVPGDVSKFCQVPTSFATSRLSISVCGTDSIRNICILTVTRFSCLFLRPPYVTIIIKALNMVCLFNIIHCLLEVLNVSYMV